MAYIGYHTRMKLVINEPHWILPYDRFIEYDQSDRWWAEKIGFGHLSDKERTVEMKVVDFSITPIELDYDLDINSRLCFTSREFRIEGVVVPTDDGSIIVRK